MTKEFAILLVGIVPVLGMVTETLKSEVEEMVVEPQSFVAEEIESMDSVQPDDVDANEQPVPYGSIQLLLEGDAPESYAIARGDTLSTICEQLLGDASFWPQLWALNPHILNPHAALYPGTVIRFYPDPSQVPSPKVVEVEPVPLPEDQVDSLDLIISSLMARVEEAKTPPQDLVDPDHFADKELDFIESSVMYPKISSEVELPGFFFPRDFAPLGWVVAEKREAREGLQDQTVLIEGPFDFQVGSRFTIVREHPNLSSDSAPYFFVAQIEVEESLSEPSDFHWAAVTQTRLPVEEGDLIISYQSPRRHLVPESNMTQGEVEGTLISFELPAKELGGHESFVFVDSGTDNGIRVGESYAIRGGVAVTSKDSEYIVTGSKGFLVIVEAWENGSVGFIYEAPNFIQLGDQIGSISGDSLRRKNPDPESPSS